MSRVFHVATFSPQDSPARIREELACPACGHEDLGDAHLRISDNTIRIFCGTCGAFVTITMSDEQALAIRRCSATLSTVGVPRLT
jgi:transcription elongation factor Elf1